MSEGHDRSDAEFVSDLRDEVDAFYRRLFHHNVGGRFHAFLEWCGVMKEHLNIVGDLVAGGHDAFHMNRHTGERLPVAPFRLSYMAEKMECIFDGALEVRPVADEVVLEDLESRIAAIVSAKIERTTQRTHHHATRKSVARELTTEIMAELAKAQVVPYAPALSQEIRDTTARLSETQQQPDIWQRHATAVLTAARILGNNPAKEDKTCA